MLSTLKRRTGHQWRCLSAHRIKSREVKKCISYLLHSIDICGRGNLPILPTKSRPQRGSCLSGQSLFLEYFISFFLCEFSQQANQEQASSHMIILTNQSSKATKLCSKKEKSADFSLEGNKIHFFVAF